MTAVVRRLQSPVVRFAVLVLVLAFVSALDASATRFAAEPSVVPAPITPSFSSTPNSQVIDWFEGTS